MSAPQQHWFARRYPIGDMRPGLAPIHWKGWALIGGFILALAGDAALAAWFAERDEIARGTAFCLMVAFGALLGFIRIRNTKGDHVKCVADYREDKISA
jgi:hypothetical protein